MMASVPLESDYHPSENLDTQRTPHVAQRNFLRDWATNISINLNTTSKLSNMMVRKYPRADTRR
jgi:hypothetical protein